MSKSEEKYPPNSRVFVGNIDTTCSKREIQDLFEPFGKVYEEIRFYRGYGFIQYDNADSAQKALQALNGFRLRNKQLDVQLAHGNGSKNLGKRKRDDNDSGPSAKRSRDDDHDNKHQGGGRNRRRDRTSQNIIDIPIFITHNSLNNYAYHVRDRLENPQQPTQFTIKCHLINLVRDSDSYLKSQQFLNRISDDRFVIVLQKRHETDNNVGFRAVLPDGTSPGFEDTPIDDVISFILQNAGTSVALGSSQQPPQQQHQPQYAMPTSTGLQYPATTSAAAAVDPNAYQYPQTVATPGYNVDPRYSSSQYPQTVTPSYPGTTPTTSVLSAALSALSSGQVGDSEKALLEQLVSALKTAPSNAPPVHNNAPPTGYYDSYPSSTNYNPQVDRSNAYSPSAQPQHTYNPSSSQYSQDYHHAMSQPYRYDNTTPPATSSAGTPSVNGGPNSSIGSLLNSLSNIIKK